MGTTALLRSTCWVLVAAVVVPVWAQAPPSAASPVGAAPDASAQAGSSVPVTASPASGAATTALGGEPTVPAVAARAALASPSGGSSDGAWQKSMVRFTSRKPVLGLQAGSSRSRQRLASDGTLYFDHSTTPIVARATDKMVYLMPTIQERGEVGPAAQNLYSISMSGEVKHLLRKLPTDFTHISVRDFFAGENTLVTLLEAEGRAGDDANSPPKEVAYFLSKSDHVGDLSSLVQMDVRFKPLRVATLGPDDDVLVLGWDMGNQLPLLAVMKDDGTVRRFIDLDQRRSYGVRGAPKESAVPVSAGMTLESLQGAVFVPWADQLMLTYPGTTRPLLFLTAAGDLRSLSLALPSGFVLRDVLAGSSPRGLIARLQAEPDPKWKEISLPPRLFEFSISNGALLREIVFDNPRVADVTGIAKSSLIAVFEDTVATSDSSVTNANGSANAAGDASKQLVVSSTRLF